MTAKSPTESAPSPMDKYHEYLTSNYEGGVDRFFSPTGFLEKFQKQVEVKTQKVRNHVYASSIDEAMARMQPVVEGGEGVFDLCSEPGTGKTSVLPFRFPTKRVIVALPTPVDAWNAYNMATGPCQLSIKGLKLGTDNKVVYVDSYMAAAAILSGIMEYDVMIVDECDSDRGVTKFLSEIKVPGKLWIRMSATYGEFGKRKSKAFKVTDCEDMPDARDGLDPVVSYVKANHKRRSLLLAPDSESAERMHDLLPGSKLISTKLGLGNLQRIIVQQEGEGLFVSDDTCARGINLNLDVLFDTQLITEFAITRVITQSEAHQRHGRVGRNKNGFYRCPGLKPMDKGTSDVDMVRHNVVRAIAEVAQMGAARLRVSPAFAEENMCASSEPYVEHVRNGGGMSPDVAIVSATPSASSSGDSRPVTAMSHHSDSDRSVSSRRRESVVKAPSWVGYFSGHVGGSSKDEYVTVKKHGRALSFERRSGSGSSDEGPRNVVPDSASTVSRMFSGTSHHGGGSQSGRRRDVMRTAPQLPDAESAPYAVSRSRRQQVRDAVSVPTAPPLMDLTELTYDMDWPSLIRDRLQRGGDLPTLVPPGSWRHTSASGLGTNWFGRLDDLAVRENEFNDGEFEIVCRAWNRLVAQSWVRRTPGLSSESDVHRMEFCMRYFQSYFLLSSAG